MKKSVLLGLILFFVFVFVAKGHCWPWDKKQETPAKPAAASSEAAFTQAPAPKAAEPPRAVATEALVPAKPDPDKTRSLREKKKREINDSQWEIDVLPLSGKGAKESDVITIKDNKFSSEVFAKKGFEPSNFTLSLQDDASPVVETMQSSEKEGTVFWRVEFDSVLVSCKGIISQQLPGNKSEDYSFISTAKRPVLNVPVKAPAEKPAPPKATPVKPAASDKKKAAKK